MGTVRSKGLGNKPTIVFFQRRPTSFHKSIEGIFEDLRTNLSIAFEIKTLLFSWFSKGLVNRVRIAIQAFHNQGDINHVTGDIHFAAILLSKRKTILTVHDCGILSHTHGLRRAVIKFFWFTLPLRRVSYVTVVSQETKKELIRNVRINEQKIRVIPVAISRRYHVSPKVFNNKMPVILQVGTASNKNVMRLIEALSGIKCHLEIIGELSETLKEKLKGSNISYANFCDLSLEALINRYNNCDIVSFMSLSEGFGMPILEAQACGRAVITSNISSMPEVAGKGACFVDPFNVSKMREGLLMIIDDPDYRNRLVQEGLENVKRFDPITIANMYQSLYMELLSNNKTLRKN